MTCECGHSLNCHNGMTIPKELWDHPFEKSKELHAQVKGPYCVVCGCTSYVPDPVCTCGCRRSLHMDIAHPNGNHWRTGGCMNCAPDCNRFLQSHQNKPPTEETTRMNVDVTTETNPTFTVTIRGASVGDLNSIWHCIASGSRCYRDTEPVEAFMVAIHEALRDRN